jgi:hypothetical protein
VEGLGSHQSRRLYFLILKGTAFNVKQTDNRRRPGPLGKRDQIMEYFTIGYVVKE